MTFGSEMRELAVELVEEFSEEIGEASLHHITEVDYDTTTGKHTETYNVTKALMTFEDIRSDEVEDISFLSAHTKCTIAGDDIPDVPTVNDLITMPSGTTHRVERVTTDQYSAAYIL